MSIDFVLDAFFDRDLRFVDSFFSPRLLGFHFKLSAMIGVLNDKYFFQSISVGFFGMGVPYLLQIL